MDLILRVPNLLGITGEMDLHIEPKEWAPAIWAGMEGAKITINEVPYTVYSINLLTRVIKVKSAPQRIYVQES